MTPLAGTLMIFGLGLLMGGYMADWSWQGGPTRRSSVAWRWSRRIGAALLACGVLLFGVQLVL